MPNKRVVTLWAASRSVQQNSSFWNKIRSNPQKSSIMEGILRFILLVLFAYCLIYSDSWGEFAHSRKPTIQAEDLWRYRYPHVNSQVPFAFLLVMIAVSTMVVFWLFGSGKRRSERTAALKGITLSLLLTAMVTNFVKSQVGRPRPNYLARCYGDANYKQINDASIPCTNLEGDEFGDLQKSFPSGHSSVAFAGFGFLFLYIAGKLDVFNSRGKNDAWCLVGSLVPLFIAAWVAITRYMDYYHHVEDIIAGSLLGCVFAYMSYVCYFHPLTSENSGLPISPEVVMVKAKRSSKSLSHTLSSTMISDPFEKESEYTSTTTELLSPTTDSTARGSIMSILFTSGPVSVDVSLSRSRFSTSQQGIPIEDAGDERPYVAFYWNDTEPEVLTVPEFQALKQDVMQALSKFEKRVEIDNNPSLI